MRVIQIKNANRDLFPAELPVRFESAPAENQLAFRCNSDRVEQAKLHDAAGKGGKVAQVLAMTSADFDLVNRELNAFPRPSGLWFHYDAGAPVQ
jgi:hypothetical protein